MIEKLNINKKVIAGVQIRLSGFIKKFMNKIPKNIFGVFFVFTLIILGFLMFSREASATTYYVDSSITDTHVGSSTPDFTTYNPTTFATDTGTDSVYKTIADVNLKSFAPGDQILFKKGDTFYGHIGINYSGSFGNPIIYGAYGAGTNPIITGLTTLGSWTLSSGNIYYTSLDVPSLNMVTVDNVVKGMGRYPNTGYLAYTSHTANTSISGATVGAIPFDPAGGEVVIRKYRWILDRQPITSRTGNTINYTSNPSGYGNNANYSPLDDNGYFIQANIGTLDQDGEWYYDKVNKRLYMYFDGDPSGRIIKASTQDMNFSSYSQNYITVSNISFEGGNTSGVYLAGSNNIIFNNCNFTQQGGNALYGGNVSYININGGNISDALNNGIWIEYLGSYISVNNVKLSNIGTIAGAGRSGDGAQEGIMISGDNVTVKNSSVTNTGYNGISFIGDNADVENNFVDTVCTVKDDCAGIYSYNSDGSIIKNNIVLNAIGAYAGSEWAYWEPFGKAAGIYLDGTSKNAEVSGNTVAHGEWGGIFINMNDGNQIIDNTVYDFQDQLDFVIGAPGTITNTTIENNKLIAKTADQSSIFFNRNSDENPSLFGTIDNNYYARPIDDDDTIWTTVSNLSLVPITKRTLLDWQAYSGQDVNSHTSPKSITDVNDLRFEYNTDSTDKTISLGSNYMDVTGATYNGSITLAPFTSAVLIKNGDIIPAPTISNLSSSGSSASSRYNNLIAMGNTQAAQELAQQFPNQISNNQIPLVPSTPTTTTVTPIPSTPLTLLRILKLTTPRMWGDDVLALQTLLNTKGYDSGTPDGNFGPKTQAAVIAFQKANGLVPDGSVGPNTLKYLNGNQTITTTSPIIQPAVTRILKLLVPRMIGDDILTLQSYLNTNGYDVGTPDGIFGSKTYSAVISFQTANNLNPDGLVGAKTREMMK